jgi:hypothetical protein
MASPWAVGAQSSRWGDARDGLRTTWLAAGCVLVLSLLAMLTLARDVEKQPIALDDAEPTRTSSAAVDRSTSPPKANGTGSSGQATRRSRPPVAAPSTRKTIAPRPEPTRVATVLGQTTAEAERRVLAQVIESPADSLPRGLIDPTSGLPRNNLQAVCRVQGAAFACVVRPHEPPRQTVLVRYTPAASGRGVFTWSRPSAG